MATLLDYRASEPSNVHGQGVLPGGVTLPAVIPNTSSGLEVADLGIFLPVTTTSNRVQLTGTIGFLADIGIPQIAIIVLRDGFQIFATQQGMEGGFETDYTVTIDAVDFNVPAGFHHYQLVVVNLVNNTQARVVGPVVFTGAAYALTT